MDIGSTGFLTMLVIASLFCILMKVIKTNRDRRGAIIKAIKCKKKTPLFIEVTIIIVIISLFVTSSGCAILGQTPKPDIEIIQPTEKKIDWKVDVGGTAENIQDGYELWVLVYSDVKKQYYPVAKAEIKNCEWTVNEVPIGLEDDDGEDFDIIAVLADKNAQNIFHDYLNATEEEIYSNGKYQIPDGVEKHDKITVTRKNVGDEILEELF